MKNVEYYKQMHAKKMFKTWQNNNTNYQDKILYYINGAMQATSAKTVLDFGCGGGEQYDIGMVHKKMGVKLDNLTLYDPGVDKYSALPDKMVDVTISFDVLEHIPIDELPEVFKYIFSHTKCFCYFTIFCGLAMKILPNGENAHCTVLSQPDWKKLIAEYNVNNIPVLYTFRIPTNPAHNILNL